LSGFYAGQQGLAYHEGWLYDVPDPNNAWNLNVPDPGNYWLLSTDTVRGYRGNRTILKPGSGNNFTPNGPAVKWTINAGTRTNQRSDWACAAMLHYNRELSLAEIRQVESWLSSTYAVAGGCMASVMGRVSMTVQ
jgi:hypothetical protein